MLLQMLTIGQPPRQAQTHVNHHLTVSQINGIDYHAYAVELLRKGLIKGAVKPRAERLSDIPIGDGDIRQSGGSL
jgi:hypothetical protein